MNSRRERRARERERRALVRDLERLARFEEGGSPERPIEVASAAVIEPMAARMKCPLCGSAVRIEAHDASTDVGAARREVRLRCTRCGTPRTCYFRIAPPSAH